MKEKPFTSINEQIELLQRRGVQTDDTTRRLLMMEGYYPVVNGYKAPFIDHPATDKAGDDRNLPGTSFDDIYDLFSFDRKLRELTFHYLLRIEALIENVCTYTFTESHQGASSYLARENYATRREYGEIGLRRYDENLDKLMRSFCDAIDRPKNDAVAYYRESYGFVPLWVLMRTLTFGTTEHFFNLMSRRDQTCICKYIAETVGNPFCGKKQLAPIKARRAIDVLVKYRNLCAHDERLYCASIDKRNPVDFFGCVKYASRFMTLGDYLEFLEGIARLVDQYSEKGEILRHLLNSTGFGEFAETELPKMAVAMEA